MPYIETVPEAGASEAVAEIYEADRTKFGHLPNFTQSFSLRPDVYSAWLQLNGSIKAGMDLRRCELATVAAARRLRSSYCMLAHGSVLVDQFLDPETLRAVVDDERTAGLDAADVAVMELADKVAEDATRVTEADVDRLRSLGSLRPGHPRRRARRRGAVLLQQGPGRRRRRAGRQVRGARPRAAGCAHGRAADRRHIDSRAP
jgi:alkylhydroperoxidase family enzyme